MRCPSLRHFALYDIEMKVDRSTHIPIHEGSVHGHIDMASFTERHWVLHLETHQGVATLLEGSGTLCGWYQRDRLDHLKGREDEERGEA